MSIGYSFNPKDQASYGDLLRTLASRNAAVTLVSPDAAQIKARLARDYPGINWMPVPRTFRQWVSEGFPGTGN